jgi:hypothetical protein
MRMETSVAGDDDDELDLQYTSCARGVDGFPEIERHTFLQERNSWLAGQ